MDRETYDRGREVRAAALGEDYVAGAERNADDFSRPLQDLLTEYCRGAVWGRDGLPCKTRSTLNLAMIAVPHWGPRRTSPPSSGRSRTPQG